MTQKDYNNRFDGFEPSFKNHNFTTISKLVN